MSLILMRHKRRSELSCPKGTKVSKVVAYASRKLSKCEINYCVTHKKLLSVVYFVKCFKHYLLGKRFAVRMDHAALQWLRKVPEPVG